MQKVWYGHHERMAATKRNPGAICYGATLSWGDVRATSQDGVTWVRGGVWTHSLGDEQIGLVAMGATDQVVNSITAEFDYVRVYSLEGGPRR